MQDGPLEPRYVVTHKDGKPVNPKRRLFILSMDTDPAALDAIAAYVNAIETTHPILAADLRREYQLCDQTNIAIERCGCFQHADETTKAIRRGELGMHGE